ELHVKPEAADFVGEDVETGRCSRLQSVFALDHALVDLRAALDVIGLDRQELLEDIGRSVGLERPNFHLAEPLTAEAGLATQGLLGDQGIRASGPGVDFVVDQMVKLEHVNITNRHLLVELLAGATVEEYRLAVLGESGILETMADRILAGSIEDRADRLE